MQRTLLAGGQILFEQDKMLLPTYDVFDEYVTSARDPNGLVI